MTERILTVKNRAGVHDQIADIISQTANRFVSDISFEKKDFKVNAKSSKGILIMAMGYNSNVTLKAEGPDEKEAVDAISKLFELKFEI